MRTGPLQAVLLLLLVASAVLPALSQEELPNLPSRTTPHVSGQAWFWNGCRRASVDLMARYGRWGRPAFGTLFYKDEDRSGAVRYYRAIVDSVKIEPTRAPLSGQVYDTNVAEWAGLGVQIWIVDSQQPGGRDDEIAGIFFDWPASMPYAHPPMATPIVEGNLSVNP